MRSAIETQTEPTGSFGFLRYDPDASDEVIGQYESLCGHLFSTVGDINISDEEFERRLGIFAEKVRGQRKSLLAATSRYRMLMKSLGLRPTVNQGVQSSPESTTGDPKCEPASQE